MRDVTIKTEDIAPGEMNQCLTRTYRLYSRAVDTDTQSLLMSRSDVATLLVMACLWLTKPE